MLRELLSLTRIDPVEQFTSCRMCPTANYRLPCFQIGCRYLQRYVGSIAVASV